VGMEIEDIASSQSSDLKSVAYVLREIEYIVRTTLPGDIAEPHLRVISGGADDLLTYVALTGGFVSGRPIPGWLPALTDLPIGLVLSLSPNHIATACSMARPCVSLEESARAFRLLQLHAAALGFSPWSAAVALNWILRHTSARFNAAGCVVPRCRTFNSNTRTRNGKWSRSRSHVGKK
jgi:hypothetical protein